MGALLSEKRLQKERKYRQPVQRLGHFFRQKLEIQYLGQRDELSPDH